ncbi:MAG: Wzz/FepE/Etk N-terminal domain-containing protein [Cellvibrionaceae bacterium]
MVSKHTEYDDEINLIELISNLWGEKVVIITCIIVVTLIGLLHTLTTTPTYQVSARLLKPSAIELSYLNQTPYFSIKPDDIFSQFIERVESSSHINNLTNTNSDLIESALGIYINENTFNSLEQVRYLEYPSVQKKVNPLIPDNYLLHYKGLERQAISRLIFSDLEAAKNSTINDIHNQYKGVLGNQANKMEREQRLALNKLEDKLEARKTLALANRHDELKQLEEALKIAEALQLNSPSSLSRLASSSTSKQVEINAQLNNNQDPLYLKGTRLLGAEIDNLRSLKPTVFFDPKIRQLESEKILLEKNRELEILKELVNKDLDTTEFTLFSQNLNAPTQPIKPQKKLTVSISLLLGLMLGLVIAIGRIIYKNRAITNY